MNSQWMEMVSSDGGTFSGHLSLPPAGKGPGIVLIHEIFGVNPHIRGVADQYAMDGFVVLAPDLFWRQEHGVELGYDEEGYTRGRALKSGLDFDQAIRDLAVAAATLRRLPNVSGKIAGIGFCMGGLLAYLMAGSGLVDAAVCYYGAGIDARLDRAPQVRCPMLFHFGEQDALIPANAVKVISKAFAHQADVWVQTYPEANHGFNCWARPMYNQRAASLARGRTLEFLSIYLGS